MLTRNITDPNQKPPAKHFSSAQSVFIQKQKQATPAITSDKLNADWAKLTDKDKQQYVKEFQKFHQQYKEQMHNYEYLKKGLTPPRFNIQVPKPIQPKNAYMRWMSEKKDHLKTQWLATKPFRESKSAFAKWVSMEWANASDAVKKPYTDSYDKEREVFNKEMAHWKEKYGPVEEPKKEKAPRVKKAKSEKSKGRSKSQKNQKTEKSKGRSQSKNAGDKKQKSEKSKGRSQSKKAGDNKTKKVGKSEKSKSRGKSQTKSKSDKQAPGKKTKEAKKDTNTKSKKK